MSIKYLLSCQMSPRGSKFCLTYNVLPASYVFTGPVLTFVDGILLDGSTQLYSFRVQTLLTEMLSEKEDKAIRFYCTHDFRIYLEVLPHLSIQRQYQHLCSVTLTSTRRTAGELHGLVSVMKQTESKRLPQNRIYFATYLLMCKFADSITCHVTSTNIALGFIQILTPFYPFLICLLPAFTEFHTTFFLLLRTMAPVSPCSRYHNILHFFCYF
jgi:hypothetical protein